MCTRRFSQPRRRAFRSTRGSMWNWRAGGDGQDQAAEFERPQFVLAVRAAGDRAQMRRVWAASHRCGSSTSGLSLLTGWNWSATHSRLEHLERLVLEALGLEQAG